MKIFELLLQLHRQKKNTRKTLNAYQNDLFVKQGREQFKKLLKLGRVPVVFL